MKQVHQNDITGHNHKKYGKNGFVCQKCKYWIDMGEDDLDSYKGCSEKYIRDYEMNDGCCPYSFNEYKQMNK
jgi:hypothetical protein